MASRNFQQFTSTMERGVVKLFLKATFAAGVATIVRGRGVKSLVRNGAGDYTLTLGGKEVDKYPALLGVQATFINATGLPAAPLCAVKADAVKASGTIGLVFSDAETPAATEIANGDTLLLEITLANTDAY